MSWVKVTYRHADGKPAALMLDFQRATDKEMRTKQAAYLIDLIKICLEFPVKHPDKFASVNVQARLYGDRIFFNLLAPSPDTWVFAIGQVAGHFCNREVVADLFNDDLDYQAFANPTSTESKLFIAQVRHALIGALIAAYPH